MTVARIREYGEMPSKIVEGPKYLSVDQNRFEQPPFETVIWVVFQSTAIPVANLKMALSQAGRGIPEALKEMGVGPIPTKEEVEEAFARDRHGIGRDGYKKAFRRASHDVGPLELVRPIPEDEIPVSFDEGIRVLRGLNRILPPFWYEYLYDGRSYFSSVGEPVQARIGKNDSLAYAGWLEQKLWTLDKNPIDFGLRGLRVYENTPIASLPLAARHNPNTQISIQSSPPEVTEIATERKGPEQLGPATNLYDQPPFDELFSKIVRGYDIPLHRLRRGTSFFARNFEKATNPRGLLKESSPEELREIAIRVIRDRVLQDALTGTYRRIEIGDTDPIMLQAPWFQVMKNIYDLLEPFSPDWTKYINDHRQLGQYQLHGDRLPNYSSKAVIPGFGVWFEKRHAARKRMADAAISDPVQEIFAAAADRRQYRAAGRIPASRRYSTAGAEDLRIQDRQRRLPDDLSGEPSS